MQDSYESSRILPVTNIKLKGTVIKLMALQTTKEDHTNANIEDALNNLNAQLRQIDEKYDLMIEREINKMYQQQVRLFMYSYDFLDQSSRMSESK